MKDPFAKPPPPPAVDSSVAILAALDQLRAAIAGAPPPPAPIITVEPPDLGEVVMAVQNLKGPATADEIAEAVARAIAPSTVEDPSLAVAIAEIAEAMKLLDFRMKGMSGGQAYGGGAVSFSQTGLTQLTEALSGLGGGVTDAQLLALAALEPTSDQVPYFTALDAADVATLTAFARTLIAAVDAAAARTVLGLGSAAVAASSDFQPVDGDLTAIAALTTTAYGRAFLALADAAAGRTALGLGTAATSASTDFQPVDSDLTAIAALSTTSFGRSVLALVDAAALRTLAGLGTAATSATTDFAPATPTVGSGLGTTGTVNLDLSTLNGTYQMIATSGNITFTTSNLAAGRTVTIIISSASTRTLTFPAWVFVGGTPTQILAGKTGVLTLTSTATTDAAVVAAWAVS